MEQTTTSILAPAMEGVNLTGVYNEYVALIPVLVPIAVSLIAIRKGIGFLFSTLNAA